MKVLILGNGISRLQYIPEIEIWRGEIWACNYAFIEYGSRIARLAGHADVMAQAVLWKKLHGYDYTLSDYTKYNEVPDKLCGNSGLFLIGQALQDGYQQIILCGFDFGGKDVWSPWMERRAVEAGMQRKWKLLLQHFPDAKKRIEFWTPKAGFDELEKNYQPIHVHAEDGNKRLREENKELNKRLGYEVIAPEPVLPTEDTRGTEYYDMIMAMFEAKEAKNARKV